MTTNKKVSAVL